VPADAWLARDSVESTWMVRELMVPMPRYRSAFKSNLGRARFSAGQSVRFISSEPHAVGAKRTSMSPSHVLEMGLLLLCL